MKKSSIIFYIILFLIEFLGIANITCILEEFIDSKFSMDINQEVIVNKIFDIATYKNMFTLDNPVSIIGLVIFGFLVLTSIFNIIERKNKKYENSFDYGSHGTSKWKDVRDIKKQYCKDRLGWFLGSIDSNKTYSVGMEAAYHRVNGDLNMQMVVVGPPGSQKTTGFVYPNIFHICDMYKDKDEKADLIITDPKSELYSLTADYLQKNNYEVKVLDFIHLKYADCLNSLDFVDDDKSLMEVAEGYINSVSAAQGGASGDSAFWNSQEAQVLAALMGFIKQKYPKERQNFYEVSKILTSEEIADVDSAKYFFLENNVTGAAEHLWNNFLMIADSDKTRANILGGLAEKLKLFAIKGIQEITNKTTVDLTVLGTKRDKPMALFIFMPDSDRTFSPVINVTVTSIFKQLYKTAYKTNNKLQSPVYFILEEMANIGRIPGIQEMLGTMRGRRIYPMMIWQSLSQMKDRYKEGFEDIMSQCDTHIYLGINDKFTATYLSDMLGDTTIKVTGTSSKKSSMMAAADSSESLSYQKRKLLMPDEAMRFDNKKLLIRQRATEPFILNKVQYQYWKYKLCETKDIFNMRKINCDTLKEKIVDDPVVDSENIELEKMVLPNEIEKDTLDIQDEELQEREEQVQGLDGQDEEEFTVDIDSLIENSDVNFEELEL